VSSSFLREITTAVNTTTINFHGLEILLEAHRESKDEMTVKTRSFRGGK
jgi:hypothetical protein